MQALAEVGLLGAVQFLFVLVLEQKGDDAQASAAGFGLPCPFLREQEVAWHCDPCRPYAPASSFCALRFSEEGFLRVSFA